MDIKNLRTSFYKDQIDFANLSNDPISLFLTWFKDALNQKTEDVNTCILSTVNYKNIPSSRAVLLKFVNRNGFVFFTNYKSSKAKDIEYNKNVALNFYWCQLERQVRISGIAKKIEDYESDKYFKERPRESQVGAWISEQSKVIDLDYKFEHNLKKVENKFKGKNIKRPLDWGGYCVSPNKMEFWQGRPYRLHDRVLYSLEDDIWKIERLSP